MRPFCVGLQPNGAVMRLNPSESPRLHPSLAPLCGSVCLDCRHKDREGQGRFTWRCLDRPFGLLTGLLPARYKKPLRLPPRLSMVHALAAVMSIGMFYTLHIGDRGQRGPPLPGNRPSGSDCISDRCSGRRTGASPSYPPILSSLDSHPLGQALSERDSSVLAALPCASSISALGSNGFICVWSFDTPFHQARL